MAMVVLVRCSDETCSVALKSCLDGLVKGGLITAYLENGEWVAVPRQMPVKRGFAARRTPMDRVVGAVA